MRAVVQRVTRAQVTVDGEITGKIENGLLILLGVAKTDNNLDADYLAEKIAGLRIFEDSEGKMNLGLEEVGGSVLVVSQFTLYGDAAKGRRPSFIEAARPEIAIPLYQRLLESLRQRGLTVAAGEFGADMQVEIHNDGPVTLILDRSA